MRKLAIVMGALALGACASSGGPEAAQPDVVCTLEARSSVAVTVLDAVTGENLAPEATVRVTDGTFAENLVATPGTGVYSGVVYEREGTYTIVVSRPEYDQWQRAGVVVERDECHVITEEVTARLTPR
ncbi:MAG TPA: hypothetical protein VMN78_01735 [Longimicrobiales bacterium]|nr:hypothetical protein [Longimicrobiales bacterium]